MFPDSPFKDKIAVLIRDKHFNIGQAMRDALRQKKPLFLAKRRKRKDREVDKLAQENPCSM